MSSITRRGLRLSALIVTAWLLSLGSLLSVAPGQLPWPAVAGAVLLRTLLQTGLFIVGHDAMHRVLLPERQAWNDRLGALVLALYAALPYGRCRTNHQHHHQHTATAADPDFHADSRAGALGWYLHFMAGYLTLRQMAWLLGAWGVLAVATGSWLNVLLYCTLPLLLSSLQLFLFGTYLPHRQQRQPLARPFPESLHWPVWLSLLACFHFGYHREHHDAPGLAWFQLPSHYRRLRALAAA
ncbi:MAG: fatty acid desaturase [Cyanobacteriota bacterium]